MRRFTRSQPNAQAISTSDQALPARDSAAETPPAGEQSNISQRLVIGMPKAINRHFFLNKLEKEWESRWGPKGEYEKKYKTRSKADVFPRSMLSDLLKSNPTSLVTAYKQGAPILWLARHQPYALKDSQGDLTRLLKVTHGGFGWDAVPAEICKLTQLQEVNFSGSGVKFVPASIGNLTQLRMLDLSRSGGFFRNYLWLPKTIGELPQLRELYLGDCKIAV